MSSLTSRFFPLGDRIPSEERRKIKEAGHMRKIPPGKSLPIYRVTWCGWALEDDLTVSAKYTGEKRPPRKGEWYLSGARIVAYRAPNDLSTAYHIAKLVVVKTARFETRTILATL